jgi:pimeloyl-ACP methyl ester carboxylesterase
MLLQSALKYGNNNSYREEIPFILSKIFGINYQSPVNEESLYGMLPQNPNHIMINNVKIACIYLQSKVPSNKIIILNQGLNSTMYYWSQLLLEVLLQKYSIVLWDYPGLLGKSQFISNLTLDILSEFLNKLIDRFGEKSSVDILGYSFGTFLVQNYLCKYKKLHKRLNKVFLVSPNLSGSKGIPSYEVFNNWVMGQDSVINSISIYFPYLSLGDINWKGETIRATLLNRLTGSLTQGMYDNYHRCVMDFQRNTLHIGKIGDKNNIKVTILSGTSDLILDPIFALIISTQIPNCNIDYIINAGHAIAFQFPITL